ncbi:hypothetical protein [Pikeienuella sp. HZG-20]|uniref:hypothetical protein n=1 Tax=Paludibacillus litoralis TaxID=3133267 RepID=UPI0030ECE36B
MGFLRLLLGIVLWPGNRFCAMVGQDVREDSGMLRGFINNLFWGAVIVATLAILL